MVAVTTEVRLRSKIHPDALAAMVGKIVTDDEYDLLLSGPTRVLKPDGKPLAVYLPGALEPALLDDSYSTLHSLKSQETDNRGLASGTERIRTTPGSRTRSKLVPSAIIGAFDPKPPFTYCRLTAWTGKEAEKFGALVPLFKRIAEHFQEHVPDRFAVQMGYAGKTHDDWRIADTPFTTITVNNTYPTGVHTDAGDLHEGFSTLAVLRKGDYSGGYLTFPEYRVAVNLQHGDLLLMDAHEWHGNTAMRLNDPPCLMCDQPATVRVLARPAGYTRFDWRALCASHDLQFIKNVPSTEVGERVEVVPAERISVVSYYRTKMTACGSAEEEAQKAAERAERRSMSMVDEMALEAAGVRTEGA